MSSFPTDEVIFFRGVGIPPTRYICTCELDPTVPSKGSIVSDKNRLRLPSGKRLHNYGKSPILMGKSTINGNFQ